MAYLTPNSLAGSRSLTVTVPDDVLLMSAIVGALTPFVYPDSWEQYGAQTPQDTAAAMADMVYGLVWDSTPGGGNTNPMYAEAKNTVFQQFSGVAAKVLFPTEVIDVDQIYDAPNNRFIAGRTGIHLLTVTLNFAVAGSIRAWVEVNGAYSCDILSDEQNPKILTSINTVSFLAGEGNPIEVWATSADNAYTAPGTNPGVTAKLVSL